MLIESRILESVLEAALSRGGEFAEVFIEDKWKTQLEMIGGKLENALSGREFGIGLRIVKGVNSFYAYTNDTETDALIHFAKKLSAMAGAGDYAASVRLSALQYEEKHQYHRLPDTVDVKEKLQWIRQISERASGYDPMIHQTVVTYMDEDQKVRIANSEGLLVDDRRVRTRTSVTCVAEHEGEMHSANQNHGGLAGFELYQVLNPDTLALSAAETAVTMARAGYAPSGRFPVVIDNGFGGVIFHEACGHGLEATFIAKGTSVFTDKLGEAVASDLVTAIDDGSMANGWGSGHVDDEGTPTQRNVLIENGILKSFLVDRVNGSKIGMATTGSSRRQSYKFAPTSRMSNTFLAPGTSTLKGIISDTDYGLYAKNMGGGSVNPATGEFNFSVTEAYMIRGGQIAEPVKGATLIGTGSEILKKIDRVADNLAYGYGMCGSASGSIPAIVGQPAIRVSEITVGGRNGGESK
jgi:TldD protein